MYKNNAKGDEKKETVIAKSAGNDKSVFFLANIFYVQ